MNPMWRDPDFCEAYRNFVTEVYPHIRDFLHVLHDHRENISEVASTIIFEAVGRYIFTSDVNFKEPENEALMCHMNAMYAVMESPQMNELLSNAMKGINFNGVNADVDE